MSDKPRYSQYLTDKATALEKTLDFFLKETGIYRRSVNESLLTFLDQIKFWDWEMDELRFSFDNFNERSKSWQDSGAGIKNSIESQLGIMLKKNAAEGVDFNRYVRKHGGAVEAPYDVCNRVIDKWNRLLKRCEEQRAKKLKEGKRLWRRHRHQTEEWWWTTCGILPEEIILLKG